MSKARDGFPEYVKGSSLARRIEMNPQAAELRYPAPHRSSAESATPHYALPFRPSPTMLTPSHIAWHKRCRYITARLLRSLHRLRNLDHMRQTVVKYIYASNVWRAADWGGALLLRVRGRHAWILQA